MCATPEAHINELTGFAMRGAGNHCRDFISMLVLYSRGDSTVNSRCRCPIGYNPVAKEHLQAYAAATGRSFMKVSRASIAIPRSFALVNR